MAVEVAPGRGTFPARDERRLSQMNEYKSMLFTKKSEFCSNRFYSSVKKYVR
jgi:hypothetical protein